MSEKRFAVDDDGIYDTQEKKHFKFIAYDWMECDIYECCDLLNELNDERMMYKTTIDKRIVELEEENEKLRQELDNFKPVMFQDMRKGTVILYSKGD